MFGGTPVKLVPLWLLEQQHHPLGFLQAAASLLSATLCCQHPTGESSYSPPGVIPFVAKPLGRPPNRPNLVLMQSAADASSRAAVAASAAAAAVAVTKAAAARAAAKAASAASRQRPSGADLNGNGASQNGSRPSAAQRSASSADRWRSEGPSDRLTGQPARHAWPLRCSLGGDGACLHVHAGAARGRVTGR